MQFLSRWATLLKHRMLTRIPQYALGIMLNRSFQWLTWKERMRYRLYAADNPGCLMTNRYQNGKLNCQSWHLFLRFQMPLYWGCASVVPNTPCYVLANNWLIIHLHKIVDTLFCTVLILLVKNEEKKSLTSKWSAPVFIYLADQAWHPGKPIVRLLFSS